MPCFTALVQKTKSKEELKKQFDEARYELDRIERAERRKQHKALVGKCYKYRNSYGSDRPKWWLYAKVVKVGDYWPEAITFQRTSLDIFEVSDNKTFTASGSYEEISRQEFARAWREFLRALELLKLP